MYFVLRFLSKSDINFLVGMGCFYHFSRKALTSAAISSIWRMEIIVSDVGGVYMHCRRR